MYELQAPYSKVKLPTGKSDRVGKVRYLPELKHSLWMQSVFACVMATIILTASRVIGIAAEGGDVTSIFLHSVILTLVAYPFQTLFSATLMYNLGHRLPLLACAVIGCILAAFPAAALSPTISWMFGVLPNVGAAIETREEFFEFVSARIHFIFFAFANLGTVLWLLLNFSWWQRRLAFETELVVRRPEPSSEELPDLMRKLAPAKRGRLLSLSAEQHYVRVRTTRGEDLVLMPFSEAITTMPDGVGMRIHRSHWVRLDAVQSISTAGSALVVRLEDDIELPVSRSFSGSVRETLADRMEA